VMSRDCVDVIVSILGCWARRFEFSFFFVSESVEGCK
jgi:hypothetical protein